MEIERNLSLLEDYAHAAGLFRPEEQLEFRLGRFIARWRLGEALASIERRPKGGRRKTVSTEMVLKEVLDEIRVTPKAALEAQRVACLPLHELEKFCMAARKDGDPPTFDRHLTYARPYWYQASRKSKLYVASGSSALNTGRSPAARRTGQVDPLLPFEIGTVNER